MRLLVSFKGMIKILDKVDSWSAFVEFIEKSYGLKLENLSLTYLDLDGDSISLTSQLDLENMLEIVPLYKDHVKVFVEEENSIKKNQNLSVSGYEQAEEQAEKDEEEPKEEENFFFNTPMDLPVHDGAFDDQEPNKSSKINCSFQSLNEWKEEMQKKIEEKMSCFFNEKIEHMMKKKIDDLSHIKQKNDKPQVIHEAKCNNCGVSPIVGVRYKCLHIKDYNLCENCEKFVDHDYNLLKMKYPEDRDESSEKNQNSCSFSKFEGKRHKVQDPLFKITKKCFRMSNIFGGEPNKFRDFVEENSEKRVSQLSQLYVKENENAELSEKVEGKVNQKVKKLAFYFGEPQTNFITIAKKNPSMTFKQLIKIVKQSREKPSEESSVLASFIKKDEPILEFSREVKKVEIKEQAKKEEKKEEKKAVRIKSKSIDLVKRNQTIVEMKDLFGEKDVYQYLKFFDIHYELSQEQIIALYIEKISEN